MMHAICCGLSIREARFSCLICKIVFCKLKQKKIYGSEAFTPVGNDFGIRLYYQSHAVASPHATYLDAQHANFGNPSGWAVV